MLGGVLENEMHVSHDSTVDYLDEIIWTLEVCGSLSLKSAYIMITSQDGLQIHWVPEICLKGGICMCFDGD